MKTFLTLATCALALLAVVACSDSPDGPPSPTPQSILLATPPAAASPDAADQPDSGIVVQLGSTPTPGPTISIAVPKKADLTHPEVGSELNDIVSRVEAGEISAEEAAGEAPIHRGDSVGVTILLSRNVDSLVRFLEDNGGSNITAGEDYIEAYVPILLLVETSQQPGVLQVRLIQPPGETQGTSQVVGNGSAVHGSPSWNQTGYTGRGIKVGIIDGGFWGLEDLLGAEVPASVQARCYTSLGRHTQNLSDCGNGMETHGTAVSESVMDIAPDVSLYISDPQSRYELSDAVDWMISEGVSVINHSRLWNFDGPGDGTSPLSISPLNTIDKAVDAGIAWVNAAGNQARGTWFKRGPDYTTVSSDDGNYKVLRFSGSNTINAESFIGGRLELRWEDEWGRAGTDLDLLVYKQGTDEIALQSIDTQSGEVGHYPYEWVSGRGPVDIVIVHYGGPDPDWIQLVGWGQTRLTLNSSGTGSIINPAESANSGMLAVGAASWTDVNSIESYSSRGPTPDGRVKPDVVGADCGETATYNTPFCGTSQAAPHVAGMAALVRQRFPNYTPAEVVAYIKENAQQRISSPDPNNTWGHGFFVLPPITPTTATAAPAAPTALTAMANGQTQINLLWSAPSDNGGAVITGYRIEVSTNGSTWSDLVANTRSTATTYAHRSLTAGTDRRYRVSAINSAGTGTASNVANATTDSPTTPPEGTNSCATGGAVADPTNNPQLVSDCDTLLEVRDTLAGTAVLNWSAGIPVANWSGVEVGGTPLRIIMLYLPHQGLTGILPPELGDLNGLMTLTLLDNKLTGPIPSELANLSQLTHIFLGDNQLGGSIPSELGRMTKLQGLELYGNRLTGTIPTELASLTSMQGLHIDNNQLTGTIPAELGRLSNLRWLTLHDNRLTGEVPTELGRLTNLQQLYISGNRFSGCVPTGLRGVSETDRTHLLKDIGIPYCDVLLSGLSITSGTLSPQFDAYVTDYRAAARASRITVSPSGRHNATFEYLDGDDIVLADADRAQAGHQVNVPAGRVTTIKIKVTSSDGKASHTYTIQLTGPGALGAPEIHQVTAGTNSLTVSWTAPVQTGGSPITAYDLRHIRSDATNKGDVNWTVVQDVWTGSGARSYELADLDGGTQYDVQVRAVNAVGDGSWSSTATGTPTSSETAPGSPANFQYVHVGSTTVVSWDASTGATHYKLYHSDSRFPRCSLFSSGTLSGCDELAANVSATTYTHANPDADTNNYWITACNSAGCSEIDSGNPAQFVDNRPAAPTGAQYVRVGSTAVVTWDQSTGATHYKVYYDNFFGTSCRLSSGSPSFCELLAGNVNGTTYTHASPDEDRNYYWVVGCNSAGCSDIDSGNPATLVETTRSATAPGAPTGLTATVNDQTRIDLRWTAPSENGGANITGYKIEVSTNGSTWSDLVSNTNSTSYSYSHTGLTAGNTRHYRVSAINSVGTGTESNVANATTGAAPAPDLVVDTATVSDSAPAAGARFTLSATVRNQGSGSSAFTTLRYYQSSDSTITISDTEIGTDSVSSLNPSGISAESLSLTAPSTPGAYYYGACVDSVSNESNTPNNCSAAVTVTVGAAPAPDLVVGTPTASDNAPAAGARFTLSATVRNQGSGSSAFTTLRYYQSADSTITTGDTEVGTDSVSGLNPSGISAESLSLTAPSTLGAYYYGACVDSVSNESNTTNNCSPAVTVTVGAAPAPDLVVDTPTVSDNAPAAGARFTLSATVRNQGNGSSAFTTLRYYQSADSTITISDTEIGTDSVSGLNPSGISAESLSLTAPSTPGAYYYGACVDSVSNESNTTNNCSAAVTVTVGAAPAPDLVVDTPTVSDNAPAAGARFTLSATVRNQGNGSSAFTTLRYYQSSDSTITISDTEIGTDSVSSLNPSGISAESLSLTAPSTPGAYHYGACVGSVSNESNTTNNCSAAVTVTVGASATAPDLVVDTPTVSNSTPFTETSFTLNVTVRNQGNGASASTRLRYYVSTDSTITTSDTFFASDLVGTLSSSSFTDKSIIPFAQSTPGAYYYGACVDSVTGESDTTNNCSAAVTVTVRDSALLTAPGAPTGLTATANGQTKIDLSWNAPSSDGGTAITGYRIEVSTNGRSWANQVNSTGSTSTRYSHTDLMAGSTRHYRVFAHNAVGTSAMSNVADATTDSPPTASAPGAPTVLTATADGQTRIDLSWTAPSDDGGASITGYRIEVSTDGSSWSDLVANTNSTSTSYSHTGLTAGSTRHYRASAINSVETGAASNVANATTDSAAQPAPDGTCTVGLIVKPGESCTYPGRSDEFSVDSAGRGFFLLVNSPTRIDARNFTFNGVVYNFLASKQSDGNWLIEEAG